MKIRFLTDILSFNKTLNKNLFGAKKVVQKNLPEIELPMPLSTDVFEYRAVDKIEQKQIWTKLRGLNRFDMQDYKDLSAQELKTMRSMVPYATRVEADETLFAAKHLKRFLDKKYGKDNFVFISIGRSSSTLMKALEFMGVDSKGFPISGLGSELSNHPNFGETDKFAAYLKNIGISKDSIKQSPKAHVFYDYTCSGRTLGFVKDLLTNELGITSSKAKFRSLNDDLQKIERRQLKDVSAKKHIAEFIDSTLRDSNAEFFSTLPSLYYRHLNKIGDITKNFKVSHDVKFFNFRMIDEITDNFT